jgi:dTDP-4-dehydrorhamnose reductase
MLDNVLITGGSGQLGSELKALAPRYAKLLRPEFTDLAELDITDEAAVQAYFTERQPRYVINCAAYTAVDKAESEPEAAEALNATAVRNLTAASKVVGADLVHISTDYVFDGCTCLPYTENDLANPRTVYGETKLHGERYALDYYRGMVIRTGWLYSRFGEGNFVKAMLRQGLKRERLGVVFDQVGTPTNAADLAFAIMEIVTFLAWEEKPFTGGLFHYSNEGVCSWYDFAVQIMRLARLRCKVQPVLSAEYPTVAHRPAYSVLDKAKVKNIYGVKVPHWIESLEEHFATASLDAIL